MIILEIMFMKVFRSYMSLKHRSLLIWKNIFHSWLNKCKRNPSVFSFIKCLWNMVRKSTAFPQFMEWANPHLLGIREDSKSWSLWIFILHIFSCFLWFLMRTSTGKLKAEHKFWYCRGWAQLTDPIRHSQCHVEKMLRCLFLAWAD